MEISSIVFSLFLGFTHQLDIDPAVYRNLDRICDGQSFNGSVSQVDVYEPGLSTDVYYSYIEFLYTDCSYVLASVNITPRVYQHTSNLSFLHSLVDVLGYVKVVTGGNISVSRRTPLLRDLSSVGGRTLLSSGASLEIRSEDTNLDGYGLRNLRRVANGDIQLNGSGCYQNTIDFETLLDNSTVSSVMRAGGDCPSDTCHSLCNTSCWGGRREDCQATHKSCHSSCSNGCFRGGPSGCCHESCVSGCKGAGRGGCLKFEGCVELYHILTGECLNNCSLPSVYHYNVSHNQLTTGYQITDKFCTPDCPGGVNHVMLGTAIQSSTCSRGGTSYPANNAINGDDRLVAIGLAGRDQYWTVELPAFIKFYYAIVVRGTSADAAICLRHISGNYQLEDVYFYTTIYETNGVPSVANLWQLCSYHGGDLGRVYTVSCDRNMVFPLTKAFGMTVHGLSLGIILREVKVFGIGGRNYALRQLTRSADSYGPNNTHLAVDGDMHTVFSTRLRHNPFWAVLVAVKIRLSYAVFILQSDTYRSFVRVQISTSMLNADDPGPYVRWQRGIGRYGWVHCNYIEVAPRPIFPISCSDASGKPVYPIFRQFGFSSSDHFTAYDIVEVELHEHRELAVGYFKHKHKCVTQCPSGYKPDASRYCVACDGACTKWCDFQDVAWEEAGVVSTLQKYCTHIKGHFSVDTVSAEYSQLKEVVSHLVHVSESLSLLLSNSSIKNLGNLLGNLRTVGSMTTPRRGASLYIEADDVHYLGLKELRRVNGNTTIKINRLCTPSLTQLNHLLSSVSTPHNNINITVNSTQCDVVTCSKECLLGCSSGFSDCINCPTTGEGFDCRKCKHYEYEGSCIAHCRQPLQLMTGTNRCYRCHLDCVGGCTGPLSTDCRHCKKYKLRDKCVEGCPSTTLTNSENKICLPCADGCKLVQREGSAYELHIEYDGFGVVSWSIVYGRPTQPISRIVNNYYVETSHIDGSERRRVMVSADVRSVNLRDAQFKLVEGRIYNVLVLANTRVDGIMSRYSPFHIQLTGKRLTVQENTLTIAVHSGTVVRVLFMSYITHHTKSPYRVKLFLPEIRASGDVLVTQTNGTVVENVSESEVTAAWSSVHYNLTVPLIGSLEGKVDLSEYVSYAVRIVFLNSNGTVETSWSLSTTGRTSFFTSYVGGVTEPFLILRTEYAVSTPDGLLNRTNQGVVVIVTLVFIMNVAIICIGYSIAQKKSTNRVSGLTRFKAGIPDGRYPLPPANQPAALAGYLSNPHPDGEGPVDEYYYKFYAVPPGEVLRSMPEADALPGALNKVLSSVGKNVSLVSAVVSQLSFQQLSEASAKKLGNKSSKHSQLKGKNAKPQENEQVERTKPKKATTKPSITANKQLERTKRKKVNSKSGKTPTLEEVLQVVASDSKKKTKSKIKENKIKSSAEKSLNERMQSHSIAPVDYSIAYKTAINTEADVAGTRPQSTTGSLQQRSEDKNLHTTTMTQADYYTVKSEEVVYQQNIEKLKLNKVAESIEHQYEHLTSADEEAMKYLNNEYQVPNNYENNSGQLKRVKGKLKSVSYTVTEKETGHVSGKMKRTDGSKKPVGYANLEKESMHKDEKGSYVSREFKQKNWSKSMAITTQKTESKNKDGGIAHASGQIKPKNRSKSMADDMKTGSMYKDGESSYTSGQINPKDRTKSMALANQKTESIYEDYGSAYISGQIKPKNKSKSMPVDDLKTRSIYKGGESTYTSSQVKSKDRSKSMALANRKTESIDEDYGSAYISGQIKPKNKSKSTPFDDLKTRSIYKDGESTYTSGQVKPKDRSKSMALANRKTESIDEDYGSAYISGQIKPKNKSKSMPFDDFKTGSTYKEGESTYTSGQVKPKDRTKSVALANRKTESIDEDYGSAYISGQIKPKKKSKSMPFDDLKTGSTNKDGENTYTSGQVKPKDRSKSMALANRKAESIDEDYGSAYISGQIKPKGRSKSMAIASSKTKYVYNDNDSAYTSGQINPRGKSQSMPFPILEEDTESVSAYISGQINMNKKSQDYINIGGQLTNEDHSSPFVTGQTKLTSGKALIPQQTILSNVTTSNDKSSKTLKRNKHRESEFTKERINNIGVGNKAKSDNRVKKSKKSVPKPRKSRAERAKKQIPEPPDV